ncbi:MAG: hypothetical protein ACM3PW_07215 [Chlamydiota bacterium]
MSPILLAALAAAQQPQPPAAPSNQPPTSNASPTLPSSAAFSRETPATTHAFWDRKNAWLFTGVGVFRVLDYTSTRNMRDRGRQEILLSNWVVDNKPLFIGIEAAATGLSIGLSYLMHRTNHHKVERLISVGHISGAAFGDARNYALKSGHHYPQ